MLHPSYNELMAAINANSGLDDDEQLVSSRYSIVIAAAKRARQIINEENAEFEMDQDGEKVSQEKQSRAEKPLSTAIRELMDGSVKILPANGDYDEDFFGANDAVGDVMYESGEGDDFTGFNDDSAERYDEYDDADEYSEKDQDDEDGEDDQMIDDDPSSDEEF